MPPALLVLFENTKDWSSSAPKARDQHLATMHFSPIGKNSKAGICCYGLLTAIPVLWSTFQSFLKLTSHIRPIPGSTWKIPLQVPKYVCNIIQWKFLSKSPRSQTAAHFSNTNQIILQLAFVQTQEFLILQIPYNVFFHHNGPFGSTWGKYNIL